MNSVTEKEVKNMVLLTKKCIHIMFFKLFYYFVLILVASHIEAKLQTLHKDNVISNITTLIFINPELF